MEAALVSGVLKIAGEKLVSLIGGEFSSIMGVKKDLSELQQLFREITSLLSAVGDRATGSDPSSYWLTSLPSSIQHLAALQSLEIRQNPGLARRCMQGKGEDWHLISHIPNVYI